MVYLQAHKLEDRIHDISLELLDVKTVSEVRMYTLNVLHKVTQSWNNSTHNHIRIYRHLSHFVFRFVYFTFKNSSWTRREYFNSDSLFLFCCDRLLFNPRRLQSREYGFHWRLSVCLPVCLFSWPLKNRCS